MIRALASSVLALALVGGGYLGLARQEADRTQATNTALVASVQDLQVDRQRAGEQERASRAAVRQAESDAKGKADSAVQSILGQAKAADDQAAKNGIVGPPKPYDGPVPASCKEYAGTQAAGCALLLQSGFGLDQMPCLVNLWNKESHWNTAAKNPSGAYGIPQALPGSKMASAGPDWQTSAETQIKWGLGYIKGRFQSPCGAWAHSQATGWY